LVLSVGGGFFGNGSGPVYWRGVVGRVYF